MCFPEALALKHIPFIPHFPSQHAATEATAGKEPQDSLGEGQCSRARLGRGAMETSRRKTHYFVFLYH